MVKPFQEHMKFCNKPQVVREVPPGMLERYTSGSRGTRVQPPPIMHVKTACLQPEASNVKFPQSRQGERWGAGHPKDTPQTRWARDRSIQPLCIGAVTHACPALRLSLCKQAIENSKFSSTTRGEVGPKAAYLVRPVYKATPAKRGVETQIAFHNWPRRKLGRLHGA